MDKVLNVLIILLFLFGMGACIAMAVAPPQNPYNPLIQPGRYTNYQINHPDATPMPKRLAELEVT